MNNCNLELQLLPSSASFSSPDSNKYYRPQMESYMRSTQGEVHPMPQQQQLTIFYNGSVCVCDVTEIQARSILMMASREVDETMNYNRSPAPSPIDIHEYQLCGSSHPTGLSMKRSLQTFLQKRKNRIQATSPYYH